MAITLSALLLLGIGGLVQWALTSTEEETVLVQVDERTSAAESRPILLGSGGLKRPLTPSHPEGPEGPESSGSLRVQVIDLSAGGVLSGAWVYGTLGRPVAGRLNQASLTGRPIQSDENGMASVPSAAAWCVAVKNGYRAQAVPVPDEASADTEVVLELDRLLDCVEGTVVDPAGYPVPGATVVSTSLMDSSEINLGRTPGGAPPSMLSQETSTDSTGRFRLPALPDSSVRVEAYAVGYAAGAPGSLAGPIGSAYGDVVSTVSVVASTGQKGLRLVLHPVRVFVLELVDEGTGAPVRMAHRSIVISGEGVLDATATNGEYVYLGDQWLRTYSRYEGGDPSKVFCVVRIDATAPIAPRHADVLILTPGYRGVKTKVDLSMPGQPVPSLVVKMALDDSPLRDVDVRLCRDYPDTIRRVAIPRLKIARGPRQVPILVSGEQRGCDLVRYSVPARDMHAVLIDGVSDAEIEIPAALQKGEVLRAVFRPPTGIALEMLDAEGRPVYGGMVFFGPPDASDVRARGTLSARPSLTWERGADCLGFQILPPSEWAVTVLKAGYEPARVSVRVPSESVVPVRVTLRKKTR